MKLILKGSVMDYQLKKESKNKQQSVANSIAKKATTNTPFQFVDKRPTKTLQLKSLQLLEQKVTQLGKKGGKKAKKPSKPKMYKPVPGGWDDDKAMKDHCWTYCDKTQTTLVQAAEKLGLQPPMLGHGSGSSKSGTGKDAQLYAVFKAYMEFALKDSPGRTLDAKAKKVLKG
ncbi:hypothetical protein H2O64_18100 [Kordia sp. YSTF-M3]|uniref:Uncharacterized protein n=1 Tax=Kordia aestuariivivens TaxID=2759037 RepID=A0ABR7QDH6_9FLAO|nr:hypothetical protein [Kordia aestuariivivens]MBC8756590.1 hypothetical protein [Kordia aestuariivivens]